MTQSELRQLLESIANGETSIDDAILKFKLAPYDDLGYAKIDHHRGIRQRAAEVIYGAGKTPEQIAGIVKNMQERGESHILITRLSSDAASKVNEYLSPISLTYHPTARIGIVGQLPEPDGIGDIIVATGGTSDMPIAEEAAITAEFLGNRVTRLYDVGIAGLHRILGHLATLMTAKVIIAVAGMEGALPSVIAGLVDAPVIAVPTSIGYGAAFNGLTALLAMINSCASGVSVVNIDNGFGAAFQASQINHIH